MATNDIGKRRLRMAMIGGGPGALIGEIHRKAARLDGGIELVAGAFSSDPEKSRRQGEELFLDPNRVYGDWRDMLRKEAAMPPEKRVDIVSVVTPNHLHLEQSRAALAAGFHVVQDKPLTLTVAQARELCQAVESSGKVFALTHTYSGYPMVRLARRLVGEGKLGRLRKIVARYPQGWLFRKFEDDPGNKQAGWRTDPARSGAGCLGDIGTHAAHLSEFISGRRILEVAADVTTFVPGRLNDDDASVLAHWEGGAKGAILVSQIEAGEENNISIAVYGDEAGLEWNHRDNEHLVLRYPDRPMEVWSRGGPGDSGVNRAPACHPEGYIEAFANIYLAAAAAVVKVDAGTPVAEAAVDFPTVHDGLRGMLFVEAALASSSAGGAWTRLDS